MLSNVSNKKKIITKKIKKEEEQLYETGKHLRTNRILNIQ